jgi:hypothetical protein
MKSLESKSRGKESIYPFFTNLWLLIAWESFEIGRNEKEKEESWQMLTLHSEKLK